MTIRIRGLSAKRVDRYIADVESLVDDALRRALESVTIKLNGHVLRAAGDESDVPVVVTVDDLGTIATVWRQQVADNIAPHVIEVWRDAASTTAKQITSKIAKDTTIPSVSNALAEHYLTNARNRLAGVADHVWETARNELVEGMRAGESSQQLASRITGVHGLTESRAMTVARTEVISASNGGTYEQVTATGMEGVHEWLATEDARTRESHRLADGQRQPVGKPFEVGGSKLRYPGDPLGSVDEIVNCRCTEIYDLDESVSTDRVLSDVTETSLQTSDESNAQDFELSAWRARISTREEHFSNITSEDATVMQEKMAAQYGAWTAAQRDAIRAYTGKTNTYVDMNEYLRDIRSNVAPEILTYIDDVQAAMKPSLMPLVVHRGTDASQFSGVTVDQTIVGRTFEDRGFLSTSVGDDSNFPGKVQLEIECPTGTPMAFVKSLSHVGDEESEMLLAAGTKFKVISVEDGKYGRKKVRVRVVP